MTNLLFNYIEYTIHFKKIPLFAGSKNFLIMDYFFDFSIDISLTIAYNNK